MRVAIPELREQASSVASLLLSDENGRRYSPFEKPALERESSPV